MIREGDIGEKLFPDFPDMKVDFSEIGIGKIGKIGLAAPPPQYVTLMKSPYCTFARNPEILTALIKLIRFTYPDSLPREDAPRTKQGSEASVPWRTSITLTNYNVEYTRKI